MGHPGWRQSPDGWATRRTHSPRRAAVGGQPPRVPVLQGAWVSTKNQEITLSWGRTRGHKMWEPNDQRHYQCRSQKSQVRLASPGRARGRHWTFRNQTKPALPAKTEEHDSQTPHPHEDVCSHHCILFTVGWIVSSQNSCWILTPL